jgi:hypothetical protein
MHDVRFRLVVISHSHLLNQPSYFVELVMNNVLTEITPPFCDIVSYKYNFTFTAASLNSGLTLMPRFKLYSMWCYCEEVSDFGKEKF